MIVPPDDARAACRAALLKACRVMGVAYEPGPDGKMHQTEAVRVDDAAACMAEREAKLRKALKGVLAYRTHLLQCEVEQTDFCTCGMKQAADAARAALAAAQEKRRAE